MNVRHGNAVRVQTAVAVDVINEVEDFALYSALFLKTCFFLEKRESWVERS